MPFGFFSANILSQIFEKGKFSFPISPFTLVYCDENYYMLGYDAAKKEIRPFRVDRMERVNTEETEREGHNAFAAIKMEDYQKYTFSMFGGKIENVRMRFQNRMMNVVIDRFGSDVFVSIADSSHFDITVPVAVSQQFFGWIFGLGNTVQIIEPDSVREQMRDKLAEAEGRYQ